MVACDGWRHVVLFIRGHVEFHLCPSHHRAMVRFLIAPCPDSKCGAGIWRVGLALDQRIEGQKALVALNEQPVIAPAADTSVLPTLSA